MDDFAIRVRGLGKRFHIGGPRQHFDSVRDQIVHTLGTPFRRARKLLRGQATGAADLDETIWALKDVSFDVRPGEKLGIIGANGAGKSTLLKILSRITEPTEGYAELRGDVRALLEVGTGFHPELTGRENIYLNAAILGMSKDEIDEKFDAIVDFAEVHKFIETPIKHFSSGMKVRLGFAVAAHLEPEVLLVDEVLSVGDAAFQEKSIGKMDEVARGGRTVLFVSHQMHMIESLCERVILLENGRIVADGDPGPVIQQYLPEGRGLHEIPLEDREDRDGKGGLVTRAIEVLDGDGKRVETPRSGQRVVFRLHYEAREDKVFRSCRVNVVVKKRDRNYFILGNDLVGPRSLDLSGSGYVDFTVPRLPLDPGKYYVTTFIESAGETEDQIDAAAELRVGGGDFYGTGQQHGLWPGAIVLVDHSCDVETAPRETSVSSAGLTGTGG